MYIRGCHLDFLGKEWANSTCLFFFFLFLVNLVHDQNLRANATMGDWPHSPQWSANKAIDGNTNQLYRSDSCAITDYQRNHTSIWWKVWLERPFSVAYLEIYFREDSKSIKVL